MVSLPVKRPASAVGERAIKTAESMVMREENIILIGFGS